MKKRKRARVVEGDMAAAIATCTGKILRKGTEL